MPMPDYLRLSARQQLSPEMLRRRNRIVYTALFIFALLVGGLIYSVSKQKGPGRGASGVPASARVPKQQ